MTFSAHILFILFLLALLVVFVHVRICVHVCVYLSVCTCTCVHRVWGTVCCHGTPPQNGSTNSPIQESLPRTPTTTPAALPTREGTQRHPQAITQVSGL